ncbi:hypothetical protein BACPU_12200 [Bacillus pumilus]|nr:hypothetical protein BACPU_12200 [Bacillus pumilus]
MRGSDDDMTRQAAIIKYASILKKRAFHQGTLFFQLKISYQIGEVLYRKRSYRKE